MLAALESDFSQYGSATVNYTKDPQKYIITDITHVNPYNKRVFESFIDTLKSLGATFHLLAVKDHFSDSWNTVKILDSYSSFSHDTDWFGDIIVPEIVGPIRKAQTLPAD